MKNIEREIKSSEITSVRLACSKRGNWSGFIEFADGSRISFKGDTAKAVIAPLIFAQGSGVSGDEAKR